MKRGSKHTTETKRKISLDNIKKGKRPPSRKGISPSLIVREKQKLALKGKKRPPFNKKWKENMSLSHKKSRPYRQGKPLIANRGKNNPNWKGGITALVFRIRHSLEYNQWRIAIFIRDNYTCQKCGEKGGKLNVDHYPKTFAQLLKENNIKSLEDALFCNILWDIKKNRTLCIGCHKKTPTYLKKLKVL